jgi:hypothetical protein
MALEGELRDFNILEVIQLLGQQGKTGVLKVRGWDKQGDEEAGIFFFEGRITHAIFTQRTKGDLLGERLAKTGIISRDELNNALRNQKKSDRFLGEIIVEGGMAEEQVVRNVLYTQVHELIYEAFRLKEGRFKFEPLPGTDFPKISVQLNADEVMLNILKMVDEWPEIEKMVPPPMMVLQRAGTLEQHGITLSADHDAVYRLVDGTKSVQEIVDMSLLGKFVTLEILAGLLEGGDIKEKGTKKAAGKKDEIAAPVAPAPFPLAAWRTRPDRARYAAGLIISCILVLVSFFPFKFNFLWKDQRGGYARQGYVEQMRQERVEWGRMIFFLEKGRYPANLTELVGAGIIAKEDVKGIDVRRKSNHP